jgi:hypothetical protein
LIIEPHSTFVEEPPITAVLGPDSRTSTTDPALLAGEHLLSRTSARVDVLVADWDRPCAVESGAFLVG